MRRLHFCNFSFHIFFFLETTLKVARNQKQSRLLSGQDLDEMTKNLNPLLKQFKLAFNLVFNRIIALRSNHTKVAGSELFFNANASNFFNHTKGWQAAISSEVNLIHNIILFRRWVIIKSSNPLIIKSN